MPRLATRRLTTRCTIPAPKIGCNLFFADHRLEEAASDVGPPPTSVIFFAGNPAPIAAAAVIGREVRKRPSGTQEERFHVVLEGDQPLEVAEGEGPRAPAFVDDELISPGPSARRRANVSCRRWKVHSASRAHATGDSCMVDVSALASGGPAQGASRLRSAARRCVVNCAHRRRGVRRPIRLPVQLRRGHTGLDGEHAHNRRHAQPPPLAAAVAMQLILFGRIGQASTRIQLTIPTQSALARGAQQRRVERRAGAQWRSPGAPPVQLALTDLSPNRGAALPPCPVNLTDWGPPGRHRSSRRGSTRTTRRYRLGPPAGRGRSRTRP